MGFYTGCEGPRLRPLPFVMVERGFKHWSPETSNICIKPLKKLLHVPQSIAHDHCLCFQRHALKAEHNAQTSHETFNTFTLYLEDKMKKEDRLYSYHLVSSLPWNRSRTVLTSFRFLQFFFANLDLPSELSLSTAPKIQFILTSFCPTVMLDLSGTKTCLFLPLCYS